MQNIVKPIETFNIQNRKYLGSKSNLLAPLLKIMIDRVGEIYSFADLFAGTGVVAEGIKKIFPDAQLVVNDILFSNYIIYQAFFGCNNIEVSVPKIYELIDKFNQVDGYYGYVSHNFGGCYFTIENAKIIDEIRDTIEEIYKKREINFKEKSILLTSLIYSIDKCANTCGQYDSYLKHLGSKSMVNGIHKIDNNVYKKLEMKYPNYAVSKNKNLIVSMDANILVEHIHTQVVYIDPPYNTRQYIDNYHILENIVKWNKPEVYGKTKKFKRDLLKSRYSQVKYAELAFRMLIKHIKAEHIFVSYNSEGLLERNEMLTILEKKGHVDIVELPYNVFGNGAGQSKKRVVTEYLFYLKCK
ncbi:MAG: DNA methyltransferase [Candidatus Margulisiibacteriota bacterium]|nr:MAG: hypothetical protein A2X43_11035 [Candidatus Margulisbacteria bacterium GWD2_39_127]OGI02763.1 MAG: hypothetical protein A2X42_01860 [Candidatus Margulisbacteria bacterium GWF2_38_17]OGI09350.1 MAG: hypothetical protein A2X41_09515 [Candidatus Margulisbacteria bacterium GWE2_39_32]PZM77436.1 MAG: DNA methyltransferase [Candidatus Margulisiibacteriota bacterium]HAR64001.1 DNA methyltransferase [Candidatus Margulisiibacteriota bacterium]